MILRRAAALAAAAWLLTVPAAIAETAAPGWSLGLQTGSDGSALTVDAVRARIAEADILLLGEMHDNPSHHAGQALAMSWRFEAVPEDRRPTVVFEMLHRDQRGALAAYDGGPEDFGAAMAWTERGWPDPAIYAPVFETAFGANANLVAADLTQETIGALFERGEDAMPAPIRRAYDLLSPLPDAVRAEMTEIQYQSHCALMPRERMGGMVRVQRARDAALAEAVLDAYERDGPPVVLIAGNGHVRQDHGTGRLLQEALPDARIVTIGFREAPLEPGPEPYDIVWLTDRPERGDPCEALRERFGDN